MNTDIEHLTSYPAPLDKLLTYGDARQGLANWADYLALGFGPEHISDLMRMTTDMALNLADSESLEVWAPAHALRVLGALHAQEIVRPMLAFLEEPGMDSEEWFINEFPYVVGMIGPVVLPELAEFLADLSHKESVRITVTTCIEKIAEKWPDAREQCITILTRQLEKLDENEPDVNAFIVLSLVTMHAIEAAPVIKRAFDADSVELSIMGDWNEAQIELGLKKREERAPAQPSPLPLPSVNTLYLPRSSSEASRGEGASHKKTKTKMAKQSRKKNRKR